MPRLDRATPGSPARRDASNRSEARRSCSDRSLRARRSIRTTPPIKTITRSTRAAQPTASMIASAWSHTQNDQPIGHATYVHAGVEVRDAVIVDRVLERGRLLLDGPSMCTRHLGLDAPAHAAEGSLAVTEFPERRGQSFRNPQAESIGPTGSCNGTARSAQGTTRTAHLPMQITTSTMKKMCGESNRRCGRGLEGQCVEANEASSSFAACVPTS